MSRPDACFTTESDASELECQLQASVSLVRAVRRVVCHIMRLVEPRQIISMLEALIVLLHSMIFDVQTITANGLS